MNEQPLDQRGEQARAGEQDVVGKHDELDDALGRVVAAARNHLVAVKAADGRVDNDAVWRAYVELNNATFVYDELMLEACGEVTPWDVERIEAETADTQWLGGEFEPGPDEPTITISVRQRRDYEVPSVRALLRVASAVQGSEPSQDRVTPPAVRKASVSDVGDAVVELLQAGDGALGSLDIPELEPLDSVVTVSVVPEPLDMDSLDDESPDAGFQSSDGDRLVCRYYERERDADDADADGSGGRSAKRLVGDEGARRS